MKIYAFEPSYDGRDRLKESSTMMSYRIPLAIVSATLCVGAAFFQASGHTAFAAESPATAPFEMKGKNFKLAAGPVGDCKVGSECKVAVTLEAQGDYHINKDYPYKFTAADAPGVEFLGTGEKNIFSKAAGDFKQDGEKNGTMAIRFKPTVKGSVAIRGQYKMSVCSAKDCQLESQEISVAVAVR